MKNRWRSGVGAGVISMATGVGLLLHAADINQTNKDLAEVQQQTAEKVTQLWSAPVVGEPHPPAQPPAGYVTGREVAVLRIPRLGTEWSRVVREGTSEAVLVQGPGHYIDTARPGEPGNFAVAGHRVGEGSPFLNLDSVKVGDEIIVDTPEERYVYVVIDSHIVSPDEVGVIAPVPSGHAKTDSYLTLTTCHPKYSARQRLVIHAEVR